MNHKAFEEFRVIQLEFKLLRLENTLPKSSVILTGRAKIKVNMVVTIYLYRQWFEELRGLLIGKLPLASKASLSHLPYVLKSCDFVSTTAVRLNNICLSRSSSF